MLFAGKIILDNGLTMDCMIRNLSDGGAQIRVAPEVAVPNQFHLIEIRSGTAYRAQVAWRAPASAGLKFIERHDLNGAGAPIGLRQLWLGCATRGAHMHEES